MTTDDFEDSADATLDAHYYGCSWDELAEVLEVCTGQWTIYETGEKPKLVGRFLINSSMNTLAPAPITMMKKMIMMTMMIGDHHA